MAHRVVIYGAGGIGKTTLALFAPGPVAVFDLDESLPILLSQLDGHDLDIRLLSCQTWDDIRDNLHADGWDEIKTIVIDSGTRAEELATAHTLATVPDQHGQAAKSIESYGYGKGYGHVYDTFMLLLGDLDQHARAGRNVILTCHDCTTNVPNPAGEDWLRYEPRLQSGTSGKASIRLRMRDWADHLFFIGYDIDVREKKGIGSGTRTIFPNELPHCMAKSRTLDDPIPFDRYSIELWNQLFSLARKGDQT